MTKLFGAVLVTMFVASACAGFDQEAYDRRLAERNAATAPATTPSPGDAGAGGEEIENKNEEHPPPGTSSPSDTGGSSSSPPSGGAGGVAQGGAAQGGQQTGASSGNSSTGQSSSGTTSSGATSSSTGSGGSSSSPPLGGQGGAGGEGGGCQMEDCNVKSAISIVAIPLDQTAQVTLEFQGQDEYYGTNISVTITTQFIANKSAKAAHFEVETSAGSEVVFNGLTNPGAANQTWWCAGDKATIIVGAFWNPNVNDWNSPWVPVAAPVIGLNGKGGCNFKVKAVPAPILANDQDGDGYTSNNADLKLKDCDDANPFIRPNQLETWGDQHDANCDGYVDPAKWRYTTGQDWPNGLTVQLVDEATWKADQVYGTTYAMSFILADGMYQVDIPSQTAPKAFRVRALWDGNWMYSTWKSGNACQIETLVKVKDSITNVPIDKSGLVPPFNPGEWCVQFITPQ